MPTPTNRAKIQLVRGSYANILASIADLVDGELCYAKDQNKLYMVEGSTLTTLDYLANTDITETVQDAIGAAISGGTGLSSSYNDSTGLTTIDLDNTAVTPGSYGSGSAIPSLTVDAQGRVTAISTNVVQTSAGNLTVIADAGTNQSINLDTETFTIAGADGITTTTTTNGVSIDLDNTAVTPGTYGSSTAIPSITVDQQGRITSATTNTVLTDLVVAADVGTNQTISLGTETLTISGADGITTTTTTNNISIDLDNTAVTTGTYGDANSVGSFTVDQQGRLTSASSIDISIVDTNISNWATAVRSTTGIDQTSEPMGHAVRTDSTIAFNTSTRTFSIAPAVTSYDVWCKGVKFTKTTTSTLVLPNTTGLYYIYFDTAGTIQYRTSYFDWENDVPTAYIYWNATTGTAPYFADERHGITLDWATHEYLHRTRGAVIANGFSISNFTITGSGAVDSDCHVDIAGGTFFDEDLEVTIVHSSSPTTNTWEQDLVGPAQIPVIYLDGTAWRKDAATNFPFKQGSVRPQYNNYSSGSGTWSTVDAGINKFIVQFVVATHSLGSPILAVMGQGNYTNIGAAEAVDFNELTLSDFPSVEFRPLYKLIYQVGSYANSVNARLRSVIDIRQISSSGVGQALGSDHGNLSGLGDDDHLQYLHSTSDRTGVTANIDTSGILRTTNATASSSAATGALVVTGGVGIGGDINVGGNLTVNGTTVTLNTETILVEDKNIELGVVAIPSDTTANGGGITLKGATDKTINWLDATDSWTFSEHLDIASAKEYRINNIKVLDSTSLGSAIVTSNLTSVGTISTGVWNGSAIVDTYLGTISTAGKVSNSATTATNVNTANAIVARNASGDFAAGTITASLAGNASTVTTNANLTGDITSVGNATSIATGVIVNADISSSAAIDKTKISGTAITAADTGTITSTMLVDGTIVDADINASAAISGSKIVGASTSIVGVVQLTDSTSSTSTTTAATPAAVKSAYDLANLALPKAGGTLTGDITLNGQSDLRLADSDSSHWVALQAPSSVPANITWSLPSTDGNAGQALVTSGTGVLSWSAVGGGATGAEIKKFDNISSGFNGSTVTFNLTVASVAYAPPYINALIISIGGVIQEAGTAYTISGSTITFTSAPAAGLGFFGFDFGSPAAIALPGTANQLLRTNAAGTASEWASNIDIPGTLDVTSAATFDSSVTITGDLTVNGTTTNINTVNLNVEDKNIVIADVVTPSDVTADGGGITLKGTTDKTINWINATDAWTFSEHINITSAKEYRIAGTKVLDATSLGSAVVSSSLTSVGTISTGTWNGSAIAAANGGTGQTSYTNGQLLIGNSTGNTLTKATLTAGSNITITNGGGSITIASSGAGNTIAESKKIISSNYTMSTDCNGISLGPVEIANTFSVTIPDGATWAILV